VTDRKIKRLYLVAATVVAAAFVMAMRAIAKKYGSVLDISYDENRFTVMTALKLLPEKKNQ